jgi:hypothetical protein
MDLIRSYNEDLFRGYIDSAETAEHIFKAIRVGAGGRYTLPKMLSGGRNNTLTCSLMEKVG